MQAQTSVADSLLEFVRNDIRRAKESCRVFHKMSDDLDVACARYASSPKSKPIDCLENKNLLIATKAAFVHTSLDCVRKTHPATEKKKGGGGDK